MKTTILKLTGLMMAAMCLFTSCEISDVDDDKPTGVTSVEVEMLVSSETLKWAEGTFIVTFSPSGRTEEITANDIFFAIQAKGSTDAEALLLKQFKSDKVMKATCKATCDASDNKITVKPNLKVRPDTAITDDEKYDYEVGGIISYRKGIGAEHSTNSYSHGFGIKGSGLKDFLTSHNISLVWLDIL